MKIRNPRVLRNLRRGVQTWDFSLGVGNKMIMFLYLWVGNKGGKCQLVEALHVAFLEGSDWGGGGIAGKS